MSVRAEAWTAEGHVDATGEEGDEGGRKTTMEASGYVLVRQSGALEHPCCPRPMTQDVDDKIPPVATCRLDDLIGEKQHLPGQGRSRSPSGVRPTRRVVRSNGRRACGAPG
jgi:hypothetical protein